MDQSFPEGTWSQLSSTFDFSRLIRSVLRASKFSVLKFIEIAILWIYYMASLLASTSFGTSVTSLFNFLNYFVWLRITDEGSVPEMRIWSILLMKSDLKWCIHLDLFYISTTSLTWWVSLLVDFSWFVAFREHQHFLCWNLLKLLFWGLFTIPFGFSFGTFVISLFNFI